MKETLQFQAESKELLNLMINSIYSNKEIFLRELISNASDAIDKYKYLSLSSDGKLPLRDGEIHINVNDKDNTIEICDNGVGMSKDDLCVAECYANAGVIMKRMMPRAKGRGVRILKRTTHITVVLDTAK